jgi:hypothetical protein
MSRTELNIEWERRMTEFRASGQTATAWCAARDIPMHRFWYWSRKLRPNHPAQSVDPIQWLTVKMDDTPVVQDNMLTIRVGDASIEVQPGFHPELLEQVIRVLKHVW